MLVVDKFLLLKGGRGMELYKRRRPVTTRHMTCRQPKYNTINSEFASGTEVVITRERTQFEFYGMGYSKRRRDESSVCR